METQADISSRRPSQVDGSGMSGLNAGLAWIGVAVLVASIAFILGATILT